VIARVEGYPRAKDFESANEVGRRDKMGLRAHHEYNGDTDRCVGDKPGMSSDRLRSRFSASAFSEFRNFIYDLHMVRMIDDGQSHLCTEWKYYNGDYCTRFTFEAVTGYRF